VAAATARDTCRREATRGASQWRGRAEKRYKHRGVTTSPVHHRRWAAALALCAGACGEPRQLTLRIAQVEPAAIPPDAAPPPDDAGAPWCAALEGTPDRLRGRQMLYSPHPRNLCVAFVVHPDDDQSSLLQASVRRTQRVTENGTSPCLGPLGLPLANGLGEEAAYYANVVVVDLDRPESDYLLTRREVPPGDSALEGSWCLDAFRCDRLFPWVHDEVVRRCMAAPTPAMGACNLRQESSDVCPLTRLAR